MTEPRQKPGRSKQDYGTPPELLEAVKCRLCIGGFHRDLAASQDNAVAPLYYDKAENALIQPWDSEDGWNWLNPEYADIEPWVRRAYEQVEEEDGRTAVLIPASVGSYWWRDWVHEKCHVLFLSPRLTFVGCEDPYPKDCALLLYGPDIVPGYDVWTWKAQK